MKSPYFEKDFIVYTFDSYNSFATVLTEKGKLGDEYPISFMSTQLQGDELNYPAMEKKAYANFKEVK